MILLRAYNKNDLVNWVIKLFIFYTTTSTFSTTVWMSSAGKGILSIFELNLVCLRILGLLATIEIKVQFLI